jgi:hypothetical protein
MRTTVFLVALGLVSCSDRSRNNNGSSGGGEDAGVGGGPGAFAGCATAKYSAQPAPAAMLVLLDRSSSMAEGSKWSSATQAIVQALDGDTFDSMSVGLLSAPSGSEMGPSCIFGTQVACQAPGAPQVGLALAGSAKSSQPGVRQMIKDWLNANSPDTGLGDATPLYAGMQSAIAALKAWQPPAGQAAGARRILMVVTDGSIDCTQFSSRSGYADCNGCDHEWENPSNLVTLVGQANQDPAAPVDTFVVGVPGADTFDSSACMYPPYHMRLALSAIAAAGSPANVPAGCTGKSFTQSGGDPSMSCHFDMTQGNFSTANLAQTVAEVRGQVLGCTFALPTTDGGTIDPSLVNVSYTANGTSVDLYRRKDPSNPCEQTGCWDYTSDGKVQLYGKACVDVKLATDAQVQIVVGCSTIIQ